MTRVTRPGRNAHKTEVRAIKHKGRRPARIERIGKKLVSRAERHLELAGRKRKPLRKTDRNAKARPLIAYDLETTSIRAGNPEPKYITAYSQDDGVGCDFQYSGAVHSPQDGGMSHLAHLLATYFLTPELNGARFVAWNGNRFDAYIIGAALLHRDEFIIRPYLTRSKSLRGMRVQMKREYFPAGYKKKTLAWEFLDGMAMTGILRPLKDFLRTFAPDYQKLEAPDFERETFDASNLRHVEYAERDSEGLYHGLVAAQAIVQKTFGVPLQPTIGNTGIRIFAREMPWNVAVWSPALEVLHIIRDYVMRGGYCWCVKRYIGPVWKYDINQAYAAAMRDSWLPGGSCYRKPKASYSPMFPCAIYRLSAINPRNRVPFYYTRASDKLRDFGVQAIEDTWLTSTETAQLISEGWRVDVTDCYYWGEQFTMRDYVDKLERIRTAAPDGPNGAEGTMIKMIGNNSYGKTVEQLGGVDLVMARERPDGYHEYQAEDDQFRHIFFKFAPGQSREYHQPQVGAFITAHVRMEVRRAALLAPDAFLYADTDCTVFTRPVALPIDPKKYGKWKQETAGEHYRIIGKKIYASLDGKTKTAKGLNVSKLTIEDYERWFNGDAPVQSQLQRQNFVKVMTGTDMFMERTREGTGAGSLGIA